MAKGNPFLKITVNAVVLILLLFIIPIISAHEPGETEATEGFKIELTPTRIIQGDAIPLEAHITKENEPTSDLKVIFTVDKHDIGLTEELETKEREQGHYFTKYKFVNSGTHEIHVEFFSEGKKIRKTVNVEVISTGLGNEIFFAAGAVISSAIVWFFGLRGKKKKVKRSLILSVIILAIVGLGYSVYIYQTAGAAERGIIVCSQEDPNLCYWQAHIHAFVMPMACGEEKVFPTEVGDLDKQHTHEEKNIIHWHSSVPYDKNKGKIIDESVLKLGTFFDSINVKFTDSSFYDYSNEQTCPAGSGRLKMFVSKNGVWQRNSEFRDYVWDDKDIIYITFDSSSDEKVLNLLTNSRLGFPTLGVG